MHAGRDTSKKQNKKAFQYRIIGVGRLFLFVEFDAQVFASGERRKHLQDKIRSTVNAAPDDFAAVTDKEDIRFDHG